jgi:hypothetical protein
MSPAELPKEVRGCRAGRGLSDIQRNRGGLHNQSEVTVLIKLVLRAYGTRLSPLKPNTVSTEFEKRCAPIRWSSAIGRTPCGRLPGVFQVPETELRRRRSRHGGARSVFMELCRLCLARKKSLLEIGRELGGVSVSALSQNRARLATKMKRDPRLKKRFERLRAALHQNHRL